MGQWDSRKQWTAKHTNYIDSVGTFSAWCSDEEIIRFDIAVNERLVVDRLYASKLI